MRKVRWEKETFNSSTSTHRILLCYKGSPFTRALTPSVRRQTSRHRRPWRWSLRGCLREQTDCTGGARRATHRAHTAFMHSSLSSHWIHLHRTQSSLCAFHRNSDTCRGTALICVSQRFLLQHSRLYGQSLPYHRQAHTHGAAGAQCVTHTGRVQVVGATRGRHRDDVIRQALVAEVPAKQCPTSTRTYQPRPRT